MRYCLNYSVTRFLSTEINFLMDSILCFTLVGCWQKLDLFLWIMEAEKVRKKR